MKKFICTLMITSMLFGCGNAEGNSISDIEPTTERKAVVDYDTIQQFDSIDKFLSSEFCNGLREKDINIYTLSYDEERYEFNKITADGTFYEYRFHDNENNKHIIFSVSYDARKTTMGYVRSIFDNDKNISTTAENSSGSYEVYLADSPLDSKDNYGLMYLPFEKYMVSIYANDSTSDEILEYFDDFELVAESTTSIEEIDWLSMSETEISDKIDSMTDDELEIVGGDITFDEMWHIKEALSEQQRDRLAPYYTSIDAEEISDISYATVNEFKGSTFCSTMKSEGYTPYLLEYDEERYSLVRLSSEKNWYTYNLYDNIEKKNISYTIMYDSYANKIEDFADLYDGGSEDIITIAQRNGAEYEVYLSKTPYIEDTNYGLLYIPEEGCEACIYAHNSTSDEILEYFDDFELVAES